MKKICFVANNNIGSGLSGGDRIFIEFLKNWRKNANLLLVGSEEAIKISRDRGVEGIDFIESDKKDKDKNLFSFSSITIRLIKRTIKGINVFRKNKNVIKDLSYIYSVSDFYPDLIPAFYAKWKNKNIKWIAGYYLFAPTPFSKESPYKGKDFFRGLFYWLMQRPSYFIVNNFADLVFVTSEPDVEKFITRKRNKDKITVVQGGVDITESEKYLESEGIIPVSERKYDACFVGRFHYQKGVSELIDIWKRVCENRKDAKLVMIGDGLLELDVKEKINKYQLENNVDLLGFRDGLEKYEIFKQSKMMVHPATYDSGGMAAAEGMAWKLPGVSFDLEALKTYYPKGMVKTEIGNNNKFAENILELLNNKEYYEKISIDAHNLIIETWDWKKRSAKIMESILNL